MTLPDPSIVSLIMHSVEFSSRIISRLRKKKKKIRTTSRPRKQTKEEELIDYLLTHKAEDSLKKISAEYLVKNRTRILRKIEKKVLDEL